MAVNPEFARVIVRDAGLDHGDASEHSARCLPPYTGGPSRRLRRAETRPATWSSQLSKTVRSTTEGSAHMLMKLMTCLEGAIDGVLQL